MKIYTILYVDQLYELIELYVRLDCLIISIKLSGQGQEVVLSIVNIHVTIIM